MTGYDIFLSNGDLLTTINVKTIDEQDHSSLVLIGQGIPDYGTPIAQDLVWMLENFAKSTPPVKPLEGQEWYDKVHKRMNFYNGSEWRYFASPESSYSSMFDMLPASINVDFTATATIPIFAGSNTAKHYYPTHVVLIPRGPFTATSAATVNLSVTIAGDVLASQSVPIIPPSKFIKTAMPASSAFVSGTGTLNLNITTAASGGQLNYDCYLFGFVL